MSTFDFGALILLLAVIIGVANDRTWRLPRPVALLLGSLIVMMLVIAADTWPESAIRAYMRKRVSDAHLPQLLLDGLIALLLFAGSLQVDLQDLRRRAGTVFVLATGGVVLATFLFAAFIWAFTQLIGQPIPLGWCLVAGAILAPTDAVTVEGLLAHVKLPPGLHATIAGESLFNDGAAVVLFGTALAFVKGQTDMVGHGQLAEAILFEGVGGVLFGAAAGYVGYLIVRLTTDTGLALTISLALALSAYRGAVALDISGPIAVVTAGLVLAYLLNRNAKTKEWLAGLLAFWPSVDDLLNTFLYLLIGAEVLTIELSWQVVAVVLVAIPLALLTRLLSVGAPLLILRAPNVARATAILTWAGLRGGISVALALILPPSPYRNLLLTMCFGVVIFTVVVQGLLLPRVVTALSADRRAASPRNETD